MFIILGIVLLYLVTVVFVVALGEGLAYALGISALCWTLVICALSGIVLVVYGFCQL